MNQLATARNSTQLIGELVSIGRRGKKGLFTAYYRLHGKRYKRTLQTADRRLAIRRAQKLEAELLVNGQPLDRPAPKTIASALTEFLTAKQVEGRAHKTLLAYRYDLGQQFLPYCQGRGVEHLDQITASLFDQYRQLRQNSGLSRASLDDEFTTVKCFVRWCVDRDYFLKDPLRSCKLQAPPDRPQCAATPEQVRAILLAAEQGLKTPEQDFSPDLPMATQLAVLCFTGMRVGEMIHLRPCDVDLDGGWVHVCCQANWKTKNGKDRKIPIHSQLKLYLTRYLAIRPPARRSWFFARRNGNIINDRTLLVRYQNLAQALGYAIGQKNQGLVIHSLRRFFETFTINNAIPQPMVDLWMGHERQDMGRFYYVQNDIDSQRFMQQVPFEKLQSVALVK